jgi:hypothetical protein
MMKVPFKSVEFGEWSVEFKSGALRAIGKHGRFVNRPYEEPET